MTENWKERLGMVYSTDPDFKFEKNKVTEKETLPPQQQKLTVSLDRKKRKGKSVTLVSGFKGTGDDLKSLGKMLKIKCGVGGTVKNGEILVQGDFVVRVMEILQKEGYQVKRFGG
jgi:translation initiation factor 1